MPNQMNQTKNTKRAGTDAAFSAQGWRNVLVSVSLSVFFCI